MSRDPHIRISNLEGVAEKAAKEVVKSIEKIVTHVSVSERKALVHLAGFLDGAKLNPANERRNRDWASKSIDDKRSYQQGYWAGTRAGVVIERMDIIMGVVEANSKGKKI